ncbi:conserved hypothetical protein [Mucor ambiguus]|uniref:DnaJ homologue subfamily C member 28 conserved domain-containing protein n=1 Tax=Mucor ambiguus TaxID=91626 RepID=A0A0C9LXZ6_9FUNG|nr:conserved hypothetical protein [Mucor ambiguus]
MLRTICTANLPLITKLAPRAAMTHLPATMLLIRRHYNSNNTSSQRTIFDAARDEEERQYLAKSSKKQQLPDDKPWDGEEPVNHSVLRMIIDKYRAPLRVEGAARRNIPQPQSSYVPPPPQKDEKSSQLKKLEREQKERERKQNRITNAKDSAFEYAMNRKYPLDEEKAHVAENIVRSQSKKDVDWEDWDLEEKPRHIDELGLLSDARIRAARARGEFADLPGRGKPIAEDPLLNNPFVDRTEYFLNRIIQRNGAAPPWVMMQQEVDTEVSSIRSQMNSAIKRCVEQVKHEKSVVNKSLVLAQFDKLEKSYLNKELGRVNMRVRSYNVMCPAPVRKPLLEFESEIKSVVDKAGLN